MCIRSILWSKGGIRIGMNLQNVIGWLETENTRALFTKIYGEEARCETQRERYKNLLQVYGAQFGDGEISLFSSPGRAEIGGNHTDHNHGRVLTASIDLDCIGVAAKTDDGVVRVFDITYQENFSVRLDEIEKRAGETGAIALIRGVLSGFLQFGHQIGGFNVCVTSDVISAAGVSSSASFEMLICTILNTFYNDGAVDKITYARIGRYAENTYWEKQSGLMDQMGCAVGGMIAIDFADPAKPIVERVDFDFPKQAYSLMIVNTGKSHADLNVEYSAVPLEMKAVAQFFGKSVCREISMEDVLERLPVLREAVGDRAVLRAMHFMEENQRVKQQVQALQRGEFDAFLRMVTESGNASWKWLQNCYSTADFREQGVSVALALTEIFLRQHGAHDGHQENDTCRQNKRSGACRVHGGGFAGVIMTLIPDDLTDAYAAYMQKHIGDEQVYKMRIREYGAIVLDSNSL